MTTITWVRRRKGTQKKRHRWICKSELRAWENSKKNKKDAISPWGHLAQKKNKEQIARSGEYDPSPPFGS